MKPDRREITAIAVPILCAQAAVGLVLIVGAGITISGRTFWGVIIGAVRWWS